MPSGGYNLGTASGSIEIDGSGVEKGMQVAQKGVQAFRTSLQNQQAELEEYGKTMTRNALLGVTGFSIATKSAATFEKQLAAISAVSGASEEDMKRVSAAALEIGAKSAFSASQAAQAFEELVKAGIPLEEALNGAAKSTVDLAAAGEIALPRAAEIAANAMNNFNLTGKDMPRIADLIAGSANASAISVEEFAQSLSQVGAVANLTGMDFKDVAVAIAEMGNAGIKGSDAGTSLKTMLMNLIPTMDYQIEKFEEMGLLTFSADKALRAMAAKGIPAVGSSLNEVRQAVSNYLAETEGIPDDTKEMGKAVDKWLMSNSAMQNAFFTTEGNVKDLASIQQTLQESTKNMTKEQKLASLETLFGADAIRAAAVMADNGAKGYNDLATAMAKVGAEGTADKRMDSLTGDLEEMKGAWETLMIRLGSVFLPVLRDIVQGITKVIQFFAEATEFGTEMMAKWLVFKTIGTGVTGVIITLAAQFGGLLAIMLGFRAAFAFVDSAKAAFAVLASGGGIVKALSVLMTNTIRGSILFRAVFKAIELIFTKFLGFGQVIALFSAVGPALAAGATPLAVFAGLMRGLGSVFLAVMGRIGTLLTGINKVGGVFSLFGGWVGLAIRVLLGLITFGKLLYGTWEPFRTLVDNIVASVQGGFVAALDAVKNGTQAIVDGFNGASTSTEGFAGAMGMLGQGVRFLVDWLAQIWQGIVDRIVPAFQTMMSTIQSSIGPALEQLGLVVSTTLWPALQQLWTAIETQLIPALIQVVQFLAPIVGAVVAVAAIIVGVLFFALVKIVEFILGEMLPSLLELAGPVIAFLIGAIGNLIGMIAMFITPLVWLATFIVGTLIPGIVEFAGELIGSLVVAFNWVVGAIQDVIKWFQNIPAAVETINSQVNGYFTAMGQGIMDAWNGLMGWFASIWNGFMAVVNTFVAMVQARFMELVNFWRPVWEPLVAVVSAIFDVIMAVVNGFGMLFAAAWQYAVGMVTIIVNSWIAAITERWNNFFAVVNAIVATGWAWISGIWNTAMAVIQATWAGFTAVIIEQWNVLWATLQAILQPAIDWFNNTIGAWWNSMFAQSEGGTSSLQSLFDGFWSWVRSIWDGAVSYLGQVVQMGFTLIQAYVQNRMDAMRSLIQSIWSGIQGIFQGAVNWLNDITGGGFSRMVDVVLGIISGLRAGLEQRWNDIIAYFRGLPDIIRGVWNGARSWLSNVGAQILEGLLDGLRSAAANVESFFADLTSKIPDLKGPPVKDKVLLTDNGKLIMQSLYTGLDSEVGRIFDLLGSLNTDIPMSLDAVVNHRILPNEDVVGRMPVAPTALTAQEQASITMHPEFTVKVKIGDRDITDIVDVEIDEKLDEVSSLIGSGVNP